MFQFPPFALISLSFQPISNTTLLVLGSPIRIPTGLWLLPPIRGFSQVAASFFAY